VELRPPVAALPDGKPEGSVEEVNRWLGRREAFSLVAGRCSAADVECMRRIRDGKLYLGRALDWEEFCAKELHMSKSNVKHLIRLLEKFGPEYFHIAQITRISVADYRAIAPAVSAQGIAWNGEVIALTPENAGRIAAAVSALRTEAAAKTEPSFSDRLAALDAAGERLLKQFRELKKVGGSSNPYLAGSVGSLKSKVERLSLEIR
jgi:hypothetical protein